MTLLKNVPQLVLIAVIGSLSCHVQAQPNQIDIIRHDAPELAHFGKFDIGVRTIELVDPGRPDVLNTAEGGETAYYDRKLVVEVWYPASLTDNEEPGVNYMTTTRMGEITATLRGRAVRDAEALPDSGRFPLIVISHGYPGNRYLMSHLGENLASKGYVVASIDHRDSTYTNLRSPSSTIYNRPLDQILVVDRIAELDLKADSFLFGIVDVGSTGIVGYSMGGLGLINNIGGGFSDAAVVHPAAPPNKLAYRHAASNPEYHASRNLRVKAAFAIAPWGMADGVWRPEDLRNIDVPTFYLSGNMDKTSGYENGTRAIFKNAIHSDRYLLTFDNAGHNAIAPIPLPREIMNADGQPGAFHYSDPVWDSVRANNIMFHFATAFFDLYLKGTEVRREFLNVVPVANEGVYSISEGRPTPDHTYWRGFPEYTARGLTLEHLKSAE